MMNKRIIIIINGSGRSGKDSFVNFTKMHFKDWNVYNISSIDKIREAGKLLGWDGASKEQRDRKFLSNLKDLSSMFYNGPLEYMLEKFSSFKEPYIGFFHIREPEEIEKFINVLPEKVQKETILVKRDNEIEFQNHADSRVNFFDYDHIIYNNKNIYDYEVKVLKLMKKVVYKK